jgi:hypothetical protein
VPLPGGFGEISACQTRFASVVDRSFVTRAGEDDRGRSAELVEHGPSHGDMVATTLTRMNATVITR